jgi:hypothetical protein
MSHVLRNPGSFHGGTLDSVVWVHISLAQRCWCALHISMIECGLSQTAGSAFVRCWLFVGVIYTAKRQMNVLPAYALK